VIYRAELQSILVCGLVKLYLRSLWISLGVRGYEDWSTRSFKIGRLWRGKLVSNGRKGIVTFLVLLRA
jgi:hypothetical protein